MHFLFVKGYMQGTIQKARNESPAEHSCCTLKTEAENQRPRHRLVKHHRKVTRAGSTFSWWRTRSNKNTPLKQHGRGYHSIELNDQQGVFSPYLPRDVTIFPRGKSWFLKGGFTAQTFMGQRDKSEEENSAEPRWVTSLFSRKLTCLFKINLRCQEPGQGSEELAMLLLF